MLFNVSYNDRETNRKIDELVGSVYGLIERFKIGGIGSPKMRILESDSEIESLLSLDNNVDTCNIEIRPKGVILRFRSILESYALPIPFYKLTIFKDKAGEHSIYYDNFFLKVQDYQEPSLKFFTRVLKRKAAYLNESQPPF